MLRPRSPPESAVRKRRTGGFALTEALVALTILGMVLVLAHSTFASGWRAQRRIDGEGNAVAIARAKLANAGIETPLREGSYSGAESRHDWRVKIAPHEPASKSEQKSRIIAWRVRVEVDFAGSAAAERGRVQLTTIKLGERSQ